MSIGESTNRADGRLKVTGAATYTAEWDVPGLVHAFIVQSSIGWGCITSIDTSEAERADGVLAVLTPDNAPELPEKGRSAFNPPAGRILTLLQDHAVRYNGQPVGLVVAETIEQAQWAASLVRYTYEEITPEVDFDEHLGKSFPYTDKILGRDPSSTKRGEVNRGIRESDACVDVVYRTPLEVHNPMEPHAIIAEWRGGELHIHDSTQFVYGVRGTMARTLGIPAENVHVISRFAGGAFGSKGAVWSHGPLAAMAAKVVKRPVRLVLGRRQMFGLVGARPHTVQHLELGAARDGRLLAIRHTTTSSTSKLEDWVEASTLATRILYACPNQETSQHLVRLNTGTPTFNRAPGESSGTFALESAMDELAEQLGIDPLEFRLRNYAEEDPEEEKPFSSKSLRECYAIAAERFGWHERDAKVGSMRRGDKLVGWGMATSTYPVKQMPANAQAMLHPDGTVEVRAATHEIGTGSYTVMAQIAADVLGVPNERVRVVLGDTSLPQNPISAGSMTATSTGSAVHNAALALKEALVGLGVRDIANHRPDVVVMATGSSRPSNRDKYSMHAFGCVFVEVEVDESLGTVHVTRMTGAFGGGRILNPKTARSQIIGGWVYGIGMALHEEALLDHRTGRYLNAELDEYHLPVNADVGEMDVVFVDEHDPHVNEIGVKGLGEIGITGVAAAIANAVRHATGVRVRELPITPEKVMAGLTA